MKAIILLTLFISTSLWAQSWPETMYTTDKIFDQQFSGLRSYIKNLKINYPYKYIGNKLVFYKDSVEVLEERFKLIVKTQYKDKYIKETIIFESFRGIKEKFVYERWGESVRPLGVSKLTSFEFSAPQRVDAFRIEFEESKVSQYVEYSENITRSNYRIYDYGLEIHHFEEIQKNKLLSKLWFQCKKCSGDVLLATMDTRQTHFGDMSYYQGNPLRFMTPKQFFKTANRRYLSSIYGEFRMITDQGMYRFGWPVAN